MGDMADLEAGMQEEIEDQGTGTLDVESDDVPWDMGHQGVTEIPDDSQIVQIANIPVVFIHYGFGEVTITTAMPQIPQEGEEVSFDNDDVPDARVFSVTWRYSTSTLSWHAEVSIR